MFLTLQLLITGLLTGLGLAQTFHLISDNSNHSLNSNQTDTISLDDLVQSQRFADGENLILILLPGIHSLNQVLSVESFMSVKIIGENSVVRFKGNGTMLFSSISHLNIQSVKFTHGHGAASINVNGVAKISISDCSFSYFSQPTIDSFILHIRNSQSIAIDHVAFENNDATALHVTDANEVNITDCVFERNRNGAANFSFTNSTNASNASNIRIFRSNFTRNNAKIGGAIYFDTKARVLISNSIFHANSATKSGGGIYSSSGDVHISNTELTSNSATFGGAVYIIGPSNVFISHSLIDNNIATTSGGGIYTDSSDVNMTNSRLTRNNASFGGAAYIHSPSTSSIRHSIVHSNRATQFGGGFYVYSCEIYFSDNELIRNVAFQGGAIYSKDRASTSISHSVLDSNIATDSGGAIFARDSDTYISNSSQLTWNTAIFGAVIYSHGTTSNTAILHSVIDSNFATGSGGGIYAFLSDTYITASQLTRNNASYGGGVYVVGPSILSFKNSLLDKNTATVFGAGVFTYSSKIYFNNSKLTENSAFNGGAIYSKFHSSLSISHCALNGNIAAHSGGGIYTRNSSKHIEHTQLTQNIAIFGGAICSFGLTSNTSISHSVLNNNNAEKLGGAVYIYGQSTTSIIESVLAGNSATEFGAGIYVVNGKTYVKNSTMTKNSAALGGAIYSDRSRLSVSWSTFTNNSASRRGGGIYALFSNVNLTDNNLSRNYAFFGGGISMKGNKNNVLFLSKCNLTKNTANGWGGGIFVDESKLYITKTVISGNRGGLWGGGVYAEQSETYITESELSTNIADYGAALYSYSRVTIRDSQIVKNIAKSGALHIQQSTLIFRDVNTVSYNRESSIYVLNSEVRFEGPTTLSNNHGLLGGAIYSVQSLIYFKGTNGTIIITNNTANSGGGIFLRESTLMVSQPFQCTFNTAQNGGGVFAYLSILKFESKNYTSGKLKIIITDNIAHQNGGGVAAISSTLTLFRFYLYVNNNTARFNGGGLYLQQSSKVHVFKTIHESISNKIRLVRLEIKNNMAQFGSGGGVYVDDSTETGSTCRGGSTNEQTQNVFSECFIQTLNLYDFRPLANDTSYVNTFITNNTALKPGSDVYGGLLDRCTPNPFVEFKNTPNALECFRNTVEVSSTLASDAVKVILCNGSKNSSVISRGGLMKANVMAVDQVGNPMNTTINSVIVTESGVGRFKEGQTIQTTNGQCTELVYNVFSQDSSAQVELHADGPCGNIGASRQIMSVTFLPCTCPVGFQQINNSIECSCDCDPTLEQYGITDCFHDEEAVLLKTNKWIGIGNSSNTTNYNVLDCPFDFCVEKPVKISLSSPNRINEQCAFNRSGVLCGECQPGLSFVLGSSKCKQCSNVYLLLLIPFALGGVALVMFILLLNITVATGKILGLIFYANVVVASRELFLLPNTSYLLTVFIQWVNLNLGIETCFYDGMNSQAKVLLQLVFPAYLFLLMFIIIMLSKYSNSFAKLLSNRNPVAALGTLILLSYSKFQQFVIMAMKHERIDYSKEQIWFYDGNIQFLTAQHVPQFLAAIFIILLSKLFVILLLFGQWFLRCSKWKLMKWTKNTKFTGFMDVYHAPFTPKHRYWVGLLLLALMTHHTVVAFSPNKYLLLLSAGCLPVGLIVFKAFMIKVYKMWLNDFIETLFLLNLVFLAFGTFYIKITNGNVRLLATTSIGIAFTVFSVCIVGFHFYKFVIKKMVLFQKLCQTLRNAARKLTHSERKSMPEDQASILDTANNRPANGNTDDRYRADETTRANQLRLSYMDELAPVADSDYYNSVTSSVSSSNSIRERVVASVTHTVVDITEEQL